MAGNSHGIVLEHEFCPYTFPFLWTQSCYKPRSGGTVPCPGLTEPFSPRILRSTSALLRATRDIPIFWTSVEGHGRIIDILLKCSSVRFVEYWTGQCHEEQSTDRQRDGTWRTAVICTTVFTFGNGRYKHAGTTHPFFTSHTQKRTTPGHEVKRTPRVRKDTRRHRSPSQRELETGGPSGPPALQILI